MLALFPPGDTRWRSQQTPSSWREFSFAFHKVAKAIEPTFTLRQMLTHCNPISEDFGGGLLHLVPVADLGGAFRLLSMQSVSAPLLASLTSRRDRPYSDHYSSTVDYVSIHSIQVLRAVAKNTFEKQRFASAVFIVCLRRRGRAHPALHFL
jgi:hypothetical protein